MLCLGLCSLSKLYTLLQGPFNCFCEDLSAYPKLEVISLYCEVLSYLYLHYSALALLSCVCLCLISLVGHGRQMLSPCLWFNKY